MATVTLTETGIDVELSASKVLGEYRAEVVTRSRTDIPAVAFGRSQQDTLYAPGEASPMPPNVQAALALVLDWCETAAKARWSVP